MVKYRTRLDKTGQDWTRLLYYVLKVSYYGFKKGCRAKFEQLQSTKIIGVAGKAGAI
jgi:hypothetical protein